jgi:hypothetical protein
MKPSLDSYRARRDDFLAEVVTTLSKDERLVAGWLTGSLSRNDADSVSDIDLSLVVSDKYSSSLCTRLDQVSAKTSPERYSLFSQFGDPALIHENNNNAPEGGTFTFVFYAESAIMVDWILVPQSKAKRPHDSKLLFEKVGISVSPLPQPETLEQRKKSVSEKWAFFWMMTAITIKYIIRNDGVFATEWIERLHSMVRDIERWLNGEPWSYVRGSLSQLQTTREKQIESLKQLCQKMQELKPKVSEFTGLDPLMPLAEIEILFSLANNAQSEIQNRQS